VSEIRAKELEAELIPMAQTIVPLSPPKIQPPPPPPPRRPSTDPTAPLSAASAAGAWNASASGAAFDPPASMLAPQADVGPARSRRYLVPLLVLGALGIVGLGALVVVALGGAHPPAASSHPLEPASTDLGGGAASGIAGAPVGTEAPGTTAPMGTAGLGAGAGAGTSAGAGTAAGATAAIPGTANTPGTTTAQIPDVTPITVGREPVARSTAGRGHPTVRGGRGGGRNPGGNTASTRPSNPAFVQQSATIAHNTTTEDRPTNRETTSGGSSSQGTRSGQTTSTNSGGSSAAHNGSGVLAPIDAFDRATGQH